MRQVRAWDAHDGDRLAASETTRWHLPELLVESDNCFATFLWAYAIPMYLRLAYDHHSVERQLREPLEWVSSTVSGWS